MTLRNKLILSTFAVSFALSMVTVFIFLVTAKHQMEEKVERIYDSVARTFSFVQRALTKGADDVVVEFKDCRVRKAGTYIVMNERGMFIGKVENCVFYGTPFSKVIDFTVNVNGLDWFIVYDRHILERFSEERPEFFDRFINNRTVVNGMVIEGHYDPMLLKELNHLTGYKLVNRFNTLLMDFPLVVENSIPVGRVVFLKDFSPTLKEVVFTPVIFMTYTIVLVVVLSSVLFMVFNRIVKDVSMLREMASKFKELDFSDIERLNDILRKDKSRDELYSLKRSVLTMAQELEDTINKLRMEKEKFEELAYTDPLTGLNNRRFFIEESKRMIDLAKRYGESLAVLMMDIDNFKRINDEYGHDVGDLVLKQLSEVIKKNIRSSDIPARLGGEEFAVLLPKTDEEGARLVAERIRRDFRDSSVQVDGKDVWTTVSIGVAMMDAQDDIDTLLKKADEALYEAKGSGKDRVVIHRAEHQGKD